MDHEKIKEGVRLLLEGIGEDVDREGLQETPERIARMCEQIFGGLNEDASVHLNKQFHAAGNNMVLEKDITFYSVCEHHLLPFYGKAHVAYIPDGMLMYGKEASTRKQEIDRQHYTIPNQRPKDKHCGKI